VIELTSTVDSTVTFVIELTSTVDSTVTFVIELYYINKANDTIPTYFFEPEKTFMIFIWTFRKK
jgi:hypothetical protein